MEQLRKVSSLQLYTFWKNLSIGLLVIVGTIVLSVVLPYFFSPIVALVAAAVLYTMLYNNKITRSSSCMIIIYALFYCVVAYSFVTILVNICDLWQLLPFTLPKELSFFNHPFLPSLMLDPICFITMIVVYVRNDKLSICIDCKLQNGDINERGKLGRILGHESHFQIKNLIIVFGILSVCIWTYFLLFYSDANLNARDYYMFVWLNIIAFVVDELYFIFRYYNLYLDLKDNNEIISPDELRDMTAKTYLRFYVICGNHVFLTYNTPETRRLGRHVWDTPFFTKRSVNGITIPEVNQIIRRMTGVRDGDLRFFFGRKNPDLDRNSILRYFYFLDGDKDDYEINIDGEWVDFEQLKKIYSYHPQDLTQIFVSDITRMATIILTQKTFNEEGFRKNKLKSYRPSFNLYDVRNNGYDFQDDKWIRISLFNSDTRMYRLKRWWRGIKTGAGPKKSSQEWG